MRAARWLILPLLASGCAVRGLPISPYGRAVSMKAGTEAIRGELVAISADTIWVQQGDSLRPVVLAPSQRVDVQRHSFGLRRTVRWLGLTGLATAASLMIACNSYESSSEGGGDNSACIAVLPATSLFFGVAGLIFGAGNQWSSVHRLAAADTARLRSFSRYPQGLPASLRVLRLDSLRVVRPDSLRSPP